MAGDTYDTEMKELWDSLPEKKIELSELELTKLELTAQKAQTDRHKELLLDFLSYAVTCKKNNQLEWIEGFVEDINNTLEAIGDDDRFEYNKRHDVIVRIKRNE